MDASSWGDTSVVGGILHNGNSGGDEKREPAGQVEVLTQRLLGIVADDLCLQHAIVSIARGLPPKDARDVLVSLIHVLHQKRKAHILLTELVLHDIEVSELEKLPPYSELTSKMLSEFCFLELHKALEYILNPLTAQMLVENAARLEVEPSRCASREVLKDNQIVFRNAAQHCFQCLISCGPLISRHIKKIAASLFNATKEKYSGSEYKVVSAFLFTRFFLAGISAPDTFGLLLDVEFSFEVRRGLALVTKLLQGIVSEKTFESDSWMFPFNDFVTSSIPVLHQFLDKIIAEANEDRGNNVFEAHLPAIKHREKEIMIAFLLEHHREIRTHWNVADTSQASKVFSIDNMLKELELAYVNHGGKAFSTKIGGHERGKKDIDKKKTGIFGIPPRKMTEERRVKKEERKKEKQQRKEREREEKEKKKKDKEIEKERRKSTKKLGRLDHMLVSSPQRIDKIKRAFGVSLEEIMDFQKETYPEADLPVPLTFLADAIIRTGGCKKQGLFRVSAPQATVFDIEKELNKGNFAIILSLEEPHIAATLFKQWIRELADPLIPVEFYKRCYDCRDSAAECIALIAELPDLEKRVLRYIVRYLRQQILLPEVVEITKMDTDNLATIFAPSIFRPLDQTMADMIVTMNMQSQFLGSLLRNMPFPPWGTPDDENYQESDPGKSLLEEISSLLDEEIKELQEERKQIQVERERDEMKKQREKDDEIAEQLRMQRARVAEQVRLFGTDEEFKKLTLRPRRPPDSVSASNSSSKQTDSASPRVVTSSVLPGGNPSSGTASSSSLYTSLAASAPVPTISGSPRAQFSPVLSLGNVPLPAAQKTGPLSARQYMVHQLSRGNLLLNKNNVPGNVAKSPYTHRRQTSDPFRSNVQMQIPPSPNSGTSVTSPEKGISLSSTAMAPIPAPLFHLPPPAGGNMVSSSRDIAGNSTQPNQPQMTSSSMLATGPVASCTKRTLPPTQGNSFLSTSCVSLPTVPLPLERICDHCKQVVSGIAVRVAALSKVYHPEHFTCGSCSSQLNTNSFYIADGVLYCKSCEESLSSRSRIAHHSLSRTDTLGNMTTLTPNRSIAHRCAKCGSEVSADRVLSFEGRPLCADCYAGRGPSRSPQQGPLDAHQAEVWYCGRCKQVIKDNSCMMALDKYWHKHCFVCHECHTPVQKSLFFVKNGLPYCSLHK